MLDIRLIRERPDFVRERLRARGGKEEGIIGNVLRTDKTRRQQLTEVESLRAARKRAAKEIGMLMGQKKREEAEARKEETRKLGEEIADLERTIKGLESVMEDVLPTLPNLPHESVPIGVDASDNPVIRTHGEPATFSFTPKTHVELCESLQLVDFARGTKLSGSGFLLYTGIGARLERALIQFLLDLHTEQHGYREVSPPYLVKSECMFGVGQLPKFKDQAYAVQEGEDPDSLGKSYLLPTAEAPVANIHREEILAESDLPIRYCAYSPCFRAEAGAAGIGTRGMIRVHQFDKVELIKVVHPDQGYTELEDLVRQAEKVLQLLGLHYRVVLLCTGDMGFASAKTYDIEVWAPGQGGFLEVSSCSNCEDFQARRMNLRFRPAQGGPNRFPHILNGSGTALARLFVALLETHQQADGTVLIPQALQPYLKFDRINA